MWHHVLHSLSPPCRIGSPNILSNCLLNEWMDSQVAEGFSPIPRATLWDVWPSLPPALSLPMPVTGVLTLMVADFKVALDHPNTGTEMTSSDERRTGQTAEATSSPTSCLPTTASVQPGAPFQPPECGSHS